jgi:glycosyltransferase involved in cell wall biosynthesis
VSTLLSRCASVSAEYPNVLLLSDEGPNLRSAGGILLYRLFEDYPVDKLRVIERYADAARGHLECKYSSLRTPWRRFEGSRFHRWKRSLRGFNLVPHVRMEILDALVSDFAPQVVVCVMQHAAYYDAALRFAESHELPLILIIHDVNEQFEPVFPWALAASRRRDGQAYRRAVRRLCVSPEMEELCAHLYGVRGQVLYPNRSEDLLPRPIDEARRLKTDGKLTIGFVGNLNYGYGEELLRLLPAFRSSGSRLIAYSHPPGSSCVGLLDARDCLELRGFVPHYEAWRAVKSDCDVVILPYPNPAGAMERLYRHHFPSKLPEYLALGMPVLVTGPEYATGVRWALRHPASIATYSDTDVVGLSDLLVRLRDDSDLRLRLAEGGFGSGNEEFDPIRIKASFINHLIRSADPRSVSSTSC